MTPKQKYCTLKDSICTLKDHIGYIYKCELNERNFEYITGNYWMIQNIEQAMVQIELSNKTSEAKWWSLISYICDQHDYAKNYKYTKSKNGRIFVLEALLTTIRTLDKGV